MKNESTLIELSGKLLLGVKMKEDTVELENQLKNSSIQDLKSELVSDNAKKCFWINIYNSYYQIIVKQSKSTTKGVFKRKEIIIGQTAFSLDEIEHGILRRYRLKWSFGYLADPFTSKLIKNLAVDQIDYRIHFALYCGAKSCPPIAFYTLKDIDKQLNDAMSSFIDSETTIDSDNNTITTSKILCWYIGDFGGSNGIRKIVGEVLEMDLTNYKVKYSTYNWEASLDNFK